MFFEYLRLTLFYKTLQKFLNNCSTRMSARSIGHYRNNTTLRPANCDHGSEPFTTYCQMRRNSMPNAGKIPIRHDMHFFGNCKQLWRQASVHLSSVYTEYSFSSYRHDFVRRSRNRLGLNLCAVITQCSIIVDTDTCRTSGTIRLRPCKKSRCFCKILLWKVNGGRHDTMASLSALALNGQSPHTHWKR